MILLRPYPGATHLPQGLFAPAGGLTSQEPGAQLDRLQEKLRASRAPWKIVIGHHPPRSNGHHGDTEELLELLEPVFQVAMQAQIRFCICVCIARFQLKSQVQLKIYAT